MMASRKKEPTVEELQASIRKSLKRWETLKKHGGTDPFWPDGMNLNLVRNHIINDRERLRERCKALRVRPCPRESRVKVPQAVSQYYMAPGSKAAKHYLWPDRLKPKRRRKGRS